jgi:hypothetical protein
MKKTLLLPVAILLISGLFLTSCQKEVDGSMADGTNPPVQQKPRVGTTWTYRYYIYHVNGGIFKQSVLKFRATEEEIINGEKFFKIKDIDADSLIGYFAERTGGLYHYTNNTSQLLFKDTIGMTFGNYPAYFEGMALDMRIKNIGDTIQTFVGDVPANYYEGWSNWFMGDKIYYMIWYNKYNWILRETKYIVFGNQPGTYYKYASYELLSIVY